MTEQIIGAKKKLTFQVLVHFDDGGKSIFDTTMTKEQIISQLEGRPHGEFVYENNNGVKVIQRTRNDKITTYMLVPPDTIKIHQVRPDPGGAIPVDPRLAAKIQGQSQH